MAARAARRRRPAAPATPGRSATISPRSRPPPASGGRDRYRGARHRRLEPRRPDAGAARGIRVPGLGALRAGPRLHFMDNLDPGDLRALLELLPLATTRFVAISKSGGTGETLMQTCRARRRQEGRPRQTESREMFIGLTEPRSPASATACARCSRVRRRDPRTRHRRRRALLGFDQCRACCRLRSSASISPRSAPAPPGARARAAGKAPEDVPAAVGAALAVALAQAGQDHRVMMAYADRLERFTRWYVQLWAESLGKDGKGTTPIARARSGRSAQPVAALHRRAARQAVHIVTPRRRQGTEHGPRTRRARGEPDFADKTIGDSSPRRAARPRRRWRRTAPGAHIHLAARRDERSANC